MHLHHVVSRCDDVARKVPGARERETGLLGSFLCYRPGLCQCRFRVGYKGLCRAEIAEFSPANAGLLPAKAVLQAGSTAASHLRWRESSALVCVGTRTFERDGR